MKTGSRSGSRAGSPTRLEKSASRGELAEGAVVSLKKVECSASRSASRRSSATSETAEFANVSLKKSKKVKGEQSKFEVEQVSLKPIPVGEGEETAVSSSSSAGMRNEGRASSVTRQRVLRDTKFEANDEEYHDIKSSLDKLKKKEAAAAEVSATPNAGAAEAKKKAPKDASPSEDAAAKPMVFRRPKKLPLGEEETEKVLLKPVNREKRMSFTSSIECAKKAAEDEEKEEKMNERPPLLRKASYTSSLDNIAIGGEEREKVHLICFSKEMGSNVDLAQACQDQDEKKEDKNTKRSTLAASPKRWVATSTWCKCAKTTERASTRSNSSSKSRAARSRRIRNKRRWRTNWLPRWRRWMEKLPKDWKKSRRPSREDCPG